MLARFMLWAAVCPSQVGVLLNIGSCKHNHTITQGRTLVRNSVREIRPGTSMWYRPLLRIRTERAVIVDGPKVSPSNPRWWTAAILKKNRKIAISLQPFDRSWHLARWRILANFSGPTVQVSNFWKSEMAGGDRQLESHKIAIYPQRFDRSLRNLVSLWRRKTSFFTAPTV